MVEKKAVNYNLSQSEPRNTHRNAIFDIFGTNFVIQHTN